ncbi:hypothetical protein EII19_05520 [Comamonadaceae bacterium OH2310_COT-174]|nr:hypothetical protein EII19_05520 [Comamonadaceae bacterium OH2310_COT-174]
MPAPPVLPSRPAALPKRQRTRSWLSGGASHVRYDHRQRPAQLDVRCPRCGQRALATPPPALLDAMPDVRIAADGNALWDQPFDLRCTACLYRAQGVAYAQLPPLFHQISVGGRTLWAWNSEHLDMIAQALQGRDVRRHPYGFFATYIQRGWMQWRHKFIHAISQHQRKHST